MEVKTNYLHCREDYVIFSRYFIKKIRVSLQSIFEAVTRQETTTWQLTAILPEMHRSWMVAFMWLSTQWSPSILNTLCCNTTNLLCILNIFLFLKNLYKVYVSILQNMQIMARLDRTYFTFNWINFNFVKWWTFKQRVKPHFSVHINPFKLKYGMTWSNCKEHELTLAKSAISVWSRCPPPGRVIRVSVLDRSVG